jgi:hypothetical protein
MKHQTIQPFLLLIYGVMWRERQRQPVRWERTVGRSAGDNPVRDGFEQGGLCAVWWKGLLVARPIAHNEQSYM